MLNSSTMPNQEYGPELNLDSILYSNPALNAEIDSRSISGSNLKSYSEQLDSWLNPGINTGPNTGLNLRAITGSNLESHSELKSGPSLKSAEKLRLGSHMGLSLNLSLEPVSGSDFQPNLEPNLESLLKCNSGIGSEIGFECGDGPQLRALAGVERLYSRGAWSEALQAGEALQAQLRLGAANPLRLRLELLIGHTLLYGLGRRSTAESHYLEVQTQSGDPVLLAIAAQGLQRCGGLGADPPAEPLQPADAPPSCTSLRRERIELGGSAFPPQAALASACADIGGTGKEPWSAPAADPGSHAKPWLQRSSGKDLAAVSTELTSTAAKNIVVVSNIFTNNALAKNALSNNALTNNELASNADVNNSVANSAVANSPVADMEIAGNTFAGTAIANSALASNGGVDEPSPMPRQGSRHANQPSSPRGPAAPLTPWRSTPSSEQLPAPRAAVERAATARAALYGAAPDKDPGDGPVAGPAPEVNAAEMAELAKGLLLLLLD
jgi:hypothetical protein